MADGKILSIAFIAALATLGIGYGAGSSSGRQDAERLTSELNRAKKAAADGQAGADAAARQTDASLKDARSKLAALTSDLEQARRDGAAALARARAEARASNEEKDREIERLRSGPAASAAPAESTLSSGTPADNQKSVTKKNGKNKKAGKKKKVASK